MTHYCKMFSSECVPCLPLQDCLRVLVSASQIFPSVFINCFWSQKKLLYFGGNHKDKTWKLVFCVSTEDFPPHSSTSYYTALQIVGLSWLHIIWGKDCGDNWLLFSVEMTHILADTGAADVSTHLDAGYVLLSSDWGDAVSSGWGTDGSSPLRKSASMSIKSTIHSLTWMNWSNTYL